MKLTFVKALNQRICSCRTHLAGVLGYIYTARHAQDVNRNNYSRVIYLLLSENASKNFLSVFIKKKSNQYGYVNFVFGDTFEIEKSH